MEGILKSAYLVFVNTQTFALLRPFTPRRVLTRSKQTFVNEKS